MKSKSELNPHNFKTTPVIDKNLETLFLRVKELQDAADMDFVITSGLRSDELQNELISQGKTRAKHSKHLAGAACDILDEEGILANFVMINQDVLENIGLWAEHPSHTNGWVHVQMMAPASGRRVFIP